MQEVLKTELLGFVTGIILLILLNLGMLKLIMFPSLAQTRLRQTKQQQRRQLLIKLLQTRLRQIKQPQTRQLLILPCAVETDPRNDR